jgi:peptidoglycan/xylan/chitin deacetylase (PgdA/CDA1 family)
LVFGGAASALSLLARPVQAGFSWLGGARAAVSLTYDDGYDSQLENAAPVLDEFSLKATFFLTVQNMQARLEEWKFLAQKGHEVGNHTMTHPCERLLFRRTFQSG